GVKVDAALGGKGERLMEQVHQHRLAASDAAPEINAAGAPRLAKTGKEPGGRGLLKLCLQRLQPPGGGFLLRIGTQFAGFDKPAILLEKSTQAACSASSFLVAAIALAGFSPFGQPLAQFMIVWQRESRNGSSSWSSRSPVISSRLSASQR